MADAAHRKVTAGDTRSEEGENVRAREDSAHSLGLLMKKMALLFWGAAVGAHTF